MSEFQTDILIVGGGQAGGSAAQLLRKQGYTGRIMMIGDEAEPPYQRPPLSKAYFTGDMAAERLYLLKDDVWTEKQIERFSSREVVRVRPARKQADLCDGRTIGYNWLIWATGGRVRTIPCAGNSLENVFYLRSIADVTKIKNALQPETRICVIGGGYIGLEVAASARKLGHDVTVIEALDRVLARVTSEPVSRFMERVHRDHGVDLRLGVGVAAIEGDSKVTGVTLADGAHIACDMVVVGIGILPNVEALERADVACNNGVVVDAHCRTSDPHILAIGDCAAHPNIFAGGNVIRLESVQNAADQAKVAVSVIMGTPEAYADLPWFWSDQYDVKLQTAGLARDYDRIVQRGDGTATPYSVCYMRGNKLIAIDAMSAIKDFMAAKALILQGTDIDAMQLADPAVSLKSLLGV
jgi:3-phenylpropionate/trans-cinnamate dioxygenase ferredoxin reductase component